MNALTNYPPQFMRIASVALNHFIVIPCYNEAKRLKPDVFFEYLMSHPYTRFMFVNDASTDDTLDVLNKLRALCPQRIFVLDCAQNGGKAMAVYKGMRRANELIQELSLEDKPAYIGYWDADLATPLNAIEDFIRVAANLPEIEVVFGARKTMLGRRIKRNLLRRIISRICTETARIAVKLPISNTQAGAKLFKVTAPFAAALERPFSAGWLFDVELFTRLACRMNTTKDRFYEFPLVEWTEVPGSKIDTKVVIKSGFVMLRLIGEARLGLRRFGTLASS